MVANYPTLTAVEHTYYTVARVVALDRYSKGRNPLGELVGN